MPYLIDGHNLIGALPDLHLDEIDDEHQLIERLQAFCRANRKKAEIYFDRAAPGRSGPFSYGAVTSVFVSSTSSADAAIARRLRQLGPAAKNWTVVSSDGAVQADARKMHARVMSSRSFAKRLKGRSGEAGESSDPAVEADDLEEWLRLFGEGGGENEERF